MKLKANPTSPLVSIVTVNYNTAEITKQLLASLRKITYKQVEVIVVDNASVQDASDIPKQFPEVIFIQNEMNEGFAGGNNRGIRIAKGDIIFLLNNDTEVSASFIEPVLSLFEQDPSIGIVSSKLIYYHSDKRIQYAGGPGINPFTARGSFTGKGEYDNGQYDTAKQTQLAHGAAMAIHRKVFDRIGLLPEMYFLYYEELDFSEHARRSGFTIWYQPASVVLHKESMSVGKASALKVYYYYRNRFLFIRRNIFGIQGIISRLFFLTIAIPTAIVKFAMQGKWKFVGEVCKGLIWNFKYTSNSTL